MRVTGLENLSAEAKGIVWAASDFPIDRRHAARCLGALPARFQVRAAEAWAVAHAGRGNRAANLELLDLRDAFSAGGLDLAASDDDIKVAAEKRAKAVRDYLAQLATASAEAVRMRLEKYARAYRVQPPQVEDLRGLTGRMTDAKWWRRALRRAVVREIEAHAIRLGFVHRRASAYASSEAIARRAEQKRRNARALLAQVAVNDAGQEFTLAELAEKGVSNPAVRRAELMTRIGGFERFAAKRGDAAMFYTLTCPGRMHARLAASGDANPKFDGSTPRASQAYLAHTWALARAALNRAGVWVYGFRIAEPHHDGTPHWHLLLFMRPSYERGATKILARYAVRTDEAELSSEAAREARFLAKRIDPEQGSAAGYVAKYVAKNVDGFRVEGDEESAAPATDAVRHVDAWASTWGIRQFQQIGGPGVTIWRELRRLREPQSLPMFDALIEAADAGSWQEYVRMMRGIECRKRDRTVNLWRVDYARVTRYGEAAPPAIEGVEHFALELCRTRLREWSIEHAKAEGLRWQVAVALRGVEEGVRKGDARFSGHEIQQENRVGGAGLGSPWTRVNNCTQRAETGGCDVWLADYDREEARERNRAAHRGRDAPS